MNRKKAAHILENSRLVSAQFSQDTLTAAYMEAYECLDKADELERAYNALLARTQAGRETGGTQNVI